MNAHDRFQQYSIRHGRDSLIKACISFMFFLFSVGVSFTGYLYKNSEMIITFALFAIFCAVAAYHQAKRFHRHFSRLS